MPPSVAVKLNVITKKDNVLRKYKNYDSVQHKSRDVKIYQSLSEHYASVRKSILDSTSISIVNGCQFLGDIEVVHVDADLYETDLGQLSKFKFACFAITDLRFRPDFSLYSLVQSLNFDNRFSSGRYAKLFGDHDLQSSYSNTTHSVTEFSDSPFVSEMFNYVTNKFPSFKLNSCLINFYPDQKSFMPDHSDDEYSIDPESFIVTLSLGSDRTMHFKLKNSKQLIARVKLRDSMIVLFSKSSQDLYSHGLPPKFINRSCDDFIPRISATFRKLLDTNY